MELVVEAGVVTVEAGVMREGGDQGIWVEARRGVIAGIGRATPWCARTEGEGVRDGL